MSSRSPELPAAFLARADRPPRPARPRPRRRREQPRRRRGGDRRRLRHRARHPALRRRRGDGLPRRRDAAADRRARPRPRLHRRRPRPHRAPRSAARPSRRWREILALVAGRAPLLIEIKDQDGALGPDVGPLEARVAELLAGYHGPVALMSFNPHSVAALARLAPDRPRGLTTCDFDSADWSLPDYRRAELAALADVGAHRRRLRLPRPPRPRQPGGGPAQGRGPADPRLDRPQPGGGGRAPAASPTTSPSRDYRAAISRLTRAHRRPMSCPVGRRAWTARAHRDHGSRRPRRHRGRRLGRLRRRPRPRRPARRSLHHPPLPRRAGDLAARSAAAPAGSPRHLVARDGRRADRGDAALRQGPQPGRVHLRPQLGARLGARRRQLLPEAPGRRARSPPPPAAAS